MKEFRDYQLLIITKGKLILLDKHILYLIALMRLGKTAMSMKICLLINDKIPIKFITKNINMKSVLRDHADFEIKNPVQVLSMHNLKNVIHEESFVIVDEAHNFGTFPKKSKKAELLEKICKKNYVIFLSASPTPLSYSQLYHQLNASFYSPFKQYKTFKKWAELFVILKTVTTSRYVYTDYSNCIYLLVRKHTDPITLTISQKEAGFTHSSITHKFVKVLMKKLLVNFSKNLYKYFGKTIRLLGLELQIKNLAMYNSIVHQLSGGTLKVNNKRLLVDNSKVLFINKNFEGKKIAIYYKFIALKKMIQLNLKFPITYDADLFNTSTDKVFVSQFIPGRDGTNLYSADCIIFYNIDYSSTSFLQTRQRLQSYDRLKEPLVYILISNTGMLKKVLLKLLPKILYTSIHYK